MENRVNAIRIAQIMGKWNGGGVESFIMNYYRNINRNLIQFDFICDEDSLNIPYQEIESLGGRVFIVPKYQNIFKYRKALEQIFKENNYKIIHSHINTLSVFPLSVAKKCNINVRIAHSHSTSNSKEILRNIIKNVLKIFSKRYATHYFACSNHAGTWLYGENIINNPNYKVIKNAINIDRFKYSNTMRNYIRKQLNISEDEFVFGHVGRFVKTKNHIFLINLFKKIHEINPKTKLLLAGQGPLEGDIKELVNKYNLNNFVIFLGQVKNSEYIYHAIDMFLLPSLYEGLGLVLIEAQIAGLKCIASDKVPNEVNITGQVKFCDINSIDSWISSISFEKYPRIYDESTFNNSGYNIKNEAKKLENIYLNMYMGDK